MWWNVVTSVLSCYFWCAVISIFLDYLSIKNANTILTLTNQNRLSRIVMDTMHYSTSILIPYSFWKETGMNKHWLNKAFYSSTSKNLPVCGAIWKVCQTKPQNCLSITLIFICTFIFIDHLLTTFNSHFVVQGCIVSHEIS